MSNSEISLSRAAESLRPKFGDPVGDVLNHAGSVKDAYGKWLGFFIMLFALMVSARWFVAGIVTAYYAIRKLS